MEEKTRHVCVDILRGYLATRYGTTPACMGERARSLEALIVAFAGPESAEDDITEKVEDVNWARHWWTKLLPAMREEEAIRAERLANGCVEESADTVESSQADKDGDTACKSTEVDQVDELEVLQEDAYQQSLAEAAQLREHEQHFQEDLEADLDRWEKYQECLKAEKAQQWDDWAVSSEMGRADRSPELRLRIMVQHHGAGGAVHQRREMLVPVGQGQTVTMGLQVSHDALPSQARRFRACEKRVKGCRRREAAMQWRWTSRHRRRR